MALTRRAAEAGHARAQFDLGIYYRDGEGVEQDVATAVNRLQRLASQALLPRRGMS